MSDEYLKVYILRRIRDAYDILEELEELIEGLDIDENNDQE